MEIAEIIYEKNYICIYILYVSFFVVVFFHENVDLFTRPHAWTHGTPFFLLLSVFSRWLKGYVEDLAGESAASPGQATSKGAAGKQVCASRWSEGSAVLV